MSKEQRRGNREVKKPKKDKTSAAPAQGEAWQTVANIQAKERAARDKK